ncbi:MAG: VanW family protein [Acidimicrobiia bacterium]
MNRHVSSRTTTWVALALGLGAIFALLPSLYGLTRVLSRGEVMGRVEVASTPIGGLATDQALSALVAVEDVYLTRPAIFTLDGKVVSVLPREAGLDIDEMTIVQDAMAVGRQGNVVSQFAWWLGHLFSTVEVPVSGSVEDEAVEAIFDVWDTDVIASPANQGGVDLVEEELVPVYPAVGKGVDRPAAAAIVESSMVAREAQNLTIPVGTIVPELTETDVDAALAEAEQLLSESIVLVHDGTEVVFTASQLREAFRSETVVEGTPQINNFFDPEIVDSLLEPVRAELEDEPVNAEFEISGDAISIVPGAKGTEIDATETARRLTDAGLSSQRTGQLPLVEGADPEVTTEYLEGLHIEHLVSQFTTYHDCCQPRVTNIHTMADTIDGIILLPGQTFSLNDTVGERTLEGGYLPAPGILGGVLEESIGGGVSQFTTTLYNAVFWGGYEDVEHRPHSYYFSRYPEGIEATLSWRNPDLRFRNNREGALLIDTRYTDTSITARIFGSNDGRAMKGEQNGGNITIWTDPEGGPNALHVRGEVSDRYSLTDPPPPRYVANPELDVDEEKQTQTEGGGWSVTVTREIRRGDELIDSQEWVVRYAARFAVYEVHPCKLPESAVTCPPSTSTTTTIVPTSTTYPPAPPST